MKQPISVQINRLVQTMNSSADAYIRQHYPLTFSRYQVLDTLRYTGPTTQHALAEAMGVSDTVISRMMKALQELDFIMIQKDPQHGRKHIISLTEYGKTQINQLGQKLEQAFLDVLNSTIGNTEQFGKDINAILMALKHNGVIT
jgi:DNA-binding MarR family transcriptional regulator